MPRTPPGTDPWGPSLNADLDSIESKADTALGVIADRLSDESLSVKIVDTIEAQLGDPETDLVAIYNAAKA